MDNGENKQININITVSSIIRIVIILILIWLLYILRDIVLILVVAVILASAINPWVVAMKKRKIPRVLGALVIYIILFGLFILIIGLFIPPIANQISDISHNFSTYWNKASDYFNQLQNPTIKNSLLGNLQNGLQSLQSNLGKTTAGIFNALVTIFGGFISFITILVISFYMVIQEDAMRKFVSSLAPDKYQPYIFQLIKRIQEKLGGWLKWQLALGFIVGFLDFVGLSILGVKYTLVLGLWAGLTEIIPLIGPVFGAIPGVFIALITGGITKALLAAAIYLLVQLLRNNLIMPKVMQKATDLNPVVVIIVMFIGAKLAGIVGIILAIPVTLVIKVFVEDFWGKKKVEQERIESG